MALLFMDGFEGYGIADISKFWGYAYYASAGGVTIDATGGRNGNGIRGFSRNSLADYRFRWDNQFQFDSQILIVGFAFKFDYVGNDILLMQLNDPSGYQYSGLLTLTENLNLVLYRHPTTQPALEYISDFTLTPNTWYYAEVKWKCHSTEGLGELRLNEQSLHSFSNSDTRPSLGIADRISNILFQGESFVDVNYDDIYILDTTGSNNNDFLGDVRIDMVNPNGAGNYSQMTPSAGSNYQCVDEAAFDDSDYVQDAADGNKDSYTYANVPTELDDLAIFGVQLNNISKRSAAMDNRKLKGFLRTGGADYEETTAQSLSDSYFRNQTIWELDPSDSNPWTQAKINACEFGVEVNT